MVKKLTGGFFKIVHEKFRAKNGQDDSDLHNTVLDAVYKNNQELRSMGIKDTVSPLPSPALCSRPLTAVHSLYRNC